MKRNLEQFDSIAAAPSATLCVGLCGVSLTSVPCAGRTEWRATSPVMSPVMSKDLAQRPYLSGTSVRNHGISRNDDRFNLGY